LTISPKLTELTTFLQKTRAV